MELLIIMGLCYENICLYSEAYNCWRKAAQLGDTKWAPNNLKRHNQRQ